MPLDSHAYLINQGWSGKGSGLRHGAISRPVTSTQKKTLSGVGKDRDDAFPFWDHVFEAAALSIQVKLHKDSDDSDIKDTPEPSAQLHRTSTGLISNQRPKSGTPAISGTTTPDTDSGTSAPRLSVMAAAKQQAARRMLYASFFRGPVIGAADSEDQNITVVAGPSRTPPSEPSISALVDEKKSKNSKKRKLREEGSSKGDITAKEKKAESVDEERREKKRRKEAREKGKETAREIEDSAGGKDTLQCKDEDRNRKAEKKRRKEEKRARREAREQRRMLKQQKSAKGLVGSSEGEVAPLVQTTEEALSMESEAREAIACNRPMSEHKTKKRKKDSS